MSRPDTQRSRTRRARARGTCPGCNQPVDLICWRCESGICKQCGELTGDLYRRTCRDCEARRA